MSPGAAFTPGDRVQTPMGKGVVREIRSGGRLAVDINGRSVVFDASSVARVQDGARRRKPRTSPAASGSDERGAAIPSRRAVREVDLHGLTVEEALARVDEALDAALLGDAAELRLIHGKSGGRIRGSVHRRLREIRAVRAFRLDPHNSGVTIVTL